MVDKTQQPIVAPADRRLKCSRKLKEPDVAKEPKEQQTIEGAADKPSAKLKKAGQTYAVLLKTRQLTQEAEDVARDVVRELFGKEDAKKFIVSCEADVLGELVTWQAELESTTATTTKVKVKTLKEED